MGCEKQKASNYNYVNSFPKVRELKSKAIDSISLNYGYIADMLIVDTVLITLSETEQGYIQIYSMSSFELITFFSNKGRGPGEFLSPYFIPNGIHEDNKFIYIHDIFSEGLFRINVSESLYLNEFIYNNKSKEIDLPKNIRYISYIGRDVLCFTEYGSRFVIYNKITEQYHKIPFGFPDLGFPVKDRYADGLNETYVNVSPYHKKVVAATKLLPRIDFFDFGGNYLSTTIYDDEDFNKKKLNEFYISGLNDGIIWYTAKMKSDNHYIYLLVYEITEDVFFAANPLTMPNSKLLVFDWDGRPVKKLLLDKFIGEFAVDNEQNIIIAYCPLETDSPVVIYELN